MLSFKYLFSFNYLCSIINSYGNIYYPALEAATDPQSGPLAEKFGDHWAKRGYTGRVFSSWLSHFRRVVPNYIIWVSMC